MSRAWNSHAFNPLFPRWPIAPYETNLPWLKLQETDTKNDGYTYPFPGGIKKPRVCENRETITDLCAELIAQAIAEKTDKEKTNIDS